MKLIALVAFLIFSGSLLAQKAEKSEEENFFSSSLQKGELFHFGDKSIKFLEVISDSRCPEDVSCIWAGEAKLLLGVFENGKLLKEMVVSQSPSNILYNVPLNISVEGMSYFISGLELYPYPTTTAKIPQEEYFLKILIKKKI